MGNIAGSVIWELDIDSSKFSKGMSSAKSSIADLKGNMDTASSSAGGFSGALGRVGEIVAGIGLAKLANDVVNLGKSFIITGINTAQFYEDAKIGFTTLLGSAEKATNAINQIKKDALATPLDARDLVTANKLLISTGLSAEQSRQDILNLGKAIVATGGGSAELSRMAVNMQQIKNVGKATALDIKQFAYAGINIYQLLADATGKTTEQIKDMEISYELLSQALAKAGEDGGRFSKAFENAGGSFTQVYSNMMESISTLGAEILQQSGAWDILKSAMLELMNWINANKNDIIAFFKSMVDFIKQIITFLSSNKDIITSAIVGIASVLTISLIPSIVALVTAFAPFFMIAAAIGAVYYAFTHWEDIVRTVEAVFNAIIKLILDLKQSIINIFAFIASIPQQISSIIIALFLRLNELIISGFGSIVSIIFYGVPKLISDINNFFARLPIIVWFWLFTTYSKFIQWTQDTWNWLAAEVPRILGMVAVWFSELPAKIGSSLSDLGKWLGDAFKKGWSALEAELKSWPDKLITWGKNIVKAFADGISSAGNFIGKAFNDGISSARKFIEGKSPPEAGVLKDIDKWGFNIGMAWVDGIRLAISNLPNDFNDVGNQLLLGIPDNGGQETINNQKSITINQNNNINNGIDYEQMLRDQSWMLRMA